VKVVFHGHLAKDQLHRKAREGIPQALSKAVAVSAISTGYASLPHSMDIDKIEKLVHDLVGRCKRSSISRINF